MLSEIVFAKGMTFLSIALGEKDLNDAKLDVYYAVLKEMSDESFEKSIERVAKTRKFKGLPTPAEILEHDTTRDVLFADVEKEAKAMYDKFYAENTAMLEFCTVNRDKIQSDREFFKNCNYAELKTKHGDKAYTKKELYVLNALGGGDWLIDIKNYENSAVVVAKIAAEIQRAIEIKYLATNSIESKRVKKMIGAA